jgi:hypothetical protein
VFSIVLLWFKPGYIFASGDFYPPVFNLSFATRYLYSWDTTFGFGHANVAFSTFFYAVYFASLKALDTPFWISEALFYASFVTIAFTSMCFFIDYMIHDRVVSIIASFFYIFNLYNLSYILSPTYIVGLALAPAILLLMSKIIDNPKQIRYFLLTILIAFPLSYLFTTPTFLVEIFLLSVMFAIYKVLISKDRLQSLKYLFIFGGIILCLNLWWLLPTIADLYTPSLVISAKGTIMSFFFTWNRANILNAFRLNPDWVWSDQKYFSFNVKFYTTASSMYMISIIPSIFAFSAIILGKFEKKISTYAIFFTTIALISIFMETGPNGPTGSIFRLLYNILPGFWLFREPEFGIPLLVSYSALIGITLASIRKLTRRRYSVTAVATFLFVILIISYPMLNGEIIPPTYTTGQQSYIKIPSYWNQASTWLYDQNPDAAVLVLPPDPFYQLPFNWNYYGADPTNLLLQGRVIIPNPGFSATNDVGGYASNSGAANMTSELYSAILSLNASLLTDLIEEAGIQYVLVRGDINYNILMGQGLNVSSMQLQDLLSNITILHFTKDFGPLEFFQVINPTSFISSASNGAIISVSELNPTTYYVRVNSTATPFTLILRDSYDSGWRIYNGTVPWWETLFQRSIPSKPTLSFANEWQITNLSKGTITIYYQPENMAILGQILCLLSIIVIFGIILFKKRMSL